MTMRKAVLAAAVALGVISCWPPSGARAEAGPPFLRTEPTPTPPAAALASIRRSAAFEKAACNIALTRSRNRRVRALARALLQHSSILEAALTAVARRGAELPRAELLASQRQTLEQLRRLREPNFDARYLQAMRGMYEQLRQDLRSFEVNGADGLVKNLVRQAQPRVDLNLRSIRAAQDHI